MQLFGISSLVFLAFQGPVQALQMAVTCTTTADCAMGETCVAGDSDTVTQACVPSTVCGGSSMGNCPSDDSGKLACLWRPYSDCSEGCAVLHGNKGIYKCVSLSRCDAYYGGASCSDACSVNGVRCNGQGSCNMMSSNPGETPSFSCTCENGYSGEKCEIAPGSTSTNSSSTDDNYLLDDDSGSDPNDDTSADDSSTGTSDDSSSDNAQDSDGSSTSGSSEVADTESSSRGGIRAGLLIFVLVMTAITMLGTVLLVRHFSRKKKQKEQEEAEFASALASAQGVGAVGLRDLAAGHTGHTPRAQIIIM